MDLIFGINICVIAFAYFAMPSSNESPKSVQFMKPRGCQRNATCIKHSQPVSCFGISSYPETSTVYAEELFNSTDLSNFEVVQNHLDKWILLRKVPKCWQNLQPFLCALYMPKCEEGRINVLSPEWCKSAFSSCDVLKEPQFEEKFPFFKDLNCDRIKNLDTTCNTDFKNLRSNLTAECVNPLILTDNVESQFDLIHGCGVQCEDPMISREDHDQIHKMIAWGASISLLGNLFAVMSFLIGWRSGSKYPALIIFYINVCFLVSNAGWLAQFLPKAREDIVCRKDDTLRREEPTAAENISCITIFVTVYYFLMAACVWFVILTYAWHLSFRAMGGIQDRIDKKRGYFHLVAWCLPFVLTTAAASLKLIDGNSATGICFIKSSLEAKVGLVLVPLAVTIIIGGYFVGRALPFLFRIRKENSQILSAKNSAKIRQMIVKIGIFSLFCLLFVVVTFISHIYEFTNEEDWQKSFKKYVFCRILEPNANECQLESKPSVSMIQFQLLVMFGAGVVMSSWVWTSSALETWKRFINKKIFKKEVEEDIKLEKHKIIKKLYENRKEWNYNGKMSLIIQNSSYVDPLGWKFDLNSGASRVDSSFLNNAPKLIDRRGGVGEIRTESNSSNNRRKSCDSESVTVSVRRLSVESRRHSLDSQISVHVSEVTATHKTHKPRSHRSKNKGKRRRRGDFYKNRKNQDSSRRASSTSHDSTMNLKGILSSVIGTTMTSRNILKRRTGNAGLDLDDSTEGHFSIPMDLSINGNSRGGNGELSDGSNQSDEDFLPQRREVSDSDSNSDSEDTDDEEMIHRKRIEKFRRKEMYSAIQSDKNEFHIRDLEFRKKSFEQERKPRHKSEERGHRYKKNNGNQTMELARIMPRISADGASNSVERKFHKKERKHSNSDLEEAVMNKSKDKFKKYEISKHSKMMQITNFNSGSDGDEDSHLMQSSGVQIRSGSSRSKRSLTVDVGTQISTQEIATQTESPDEVSVNKSETQGTQMTPDFNVIYLNSKVLHANGNLPILKNSRHVFTPIKD